jgi:hypothetical protein
MVNYVVVYRNDTFAKKLCLCHLEFIESKHPLRSTETKEIVLTIPVSTTESEHCFITLERVLTYLRNSMGQEILHTLAVLSIHKDVIPTV